MKLAATSAKTAPTGVRHRVVALTFLLGVVLYVDRAAISVLAPALRQELGIGPMAMGSVFMAFVWGYALFNIPGGWLCDRYGARRVLAAIVVLWSVFTAATAAAWNLISLLAIRFLFGVAEAGATPSVSESFARWIPAAERARAQGFYFSGMSAGVALAPPLVTIGLLHWGWRATFVGLGALGLWWALVWTLWYRDDPAQHGGVNRKELALLPATAISGADVKVDWRRAAASRNLWAILLMYFTYGYTGYIYITWFPTYLVEARNLPIGMAGVLAALPGLLGMFAKPLGGWASDRLATRYGVVFGRRSIGILGFGLAAAAIAPALYVNDPYMAVVLFAVTDGAAALAHGVCFAVCIDTGMKRAGTISALMLTMGSLGNAVCALAFGAFLQYTGSWFYPFLIGMAANILGALLWLKIDPREQFV